MSRVGSPPRRVIAGDPSHQRPLVEHSLRSRLAVIAPSVAEVVRSTGGWLCDLGMLGWEVNVLTTDQGDLRALRILGARAHDMDAALMSPVVLGHCLKAIAVAADLYDRDERVRSMVLKVRATPSAEVRLWGDALPAGLDGAALVRHEPSLAARAFKAHALAAVGIPAAAAASTEAFRKLAPR